MPSNDFIDDGVTSCLLAAAAQAQKRGDGEELDAIAMALARWQRETERSEAFFRGEAPEEIAEVRSPANASVYYVGLDTGEVFDRHPGDRFWDPTSGQVKE